MAHNGHCDESISIDVFDREIVAKWQYVRRSPVRVPFDLLRSFPLTDGRLFLPNGFHYFDSFYFSLVVIVIVPSNFFSSFVCDRRLDDAET